MAKVTREDCAGSGTQFTEKQFQSSGLAGVTRSAYGQGLYTPRPFANCPVCGRLTAITTRGMMKHKPAAPAAK